MKSAKIVSILSVLFVFIALSANAQGGPPPQGGSTSGPIDSGALVLLVGAAVYGYNRLKTNEKAEV
ncbi:MAG: hypothetical protein JWO06_4111 [Bacteroidota bacterium]|nr:hypothetical protein [Bacteroidota bacterium]